MMNTLASKLKNVDKEKLYKIIVILVIILGSMIRIIGIDKQPSALNVDEISSGYEAFSILHYGIDRNGKFLPVFLQAWGSGQNALLTYLIIPDEVLIFFGIYFIIIQFFLSGFMGVLYHLAVGLFLFIIMYLIMIIGNKAFKKESMGGGDVKMMFLFGLVLDPLLGALTIFLGSLFALPISIGLYFSKNEKVIPFGPFLLLGFAFIFFTKITSQGIISWLGL